MTSTLPSWPQYSEDEISAVCNVLKSGKTNQWSGNQVKCFETEYAKHLGIKHAVACANGSVALELAWRALELQPGDEILLSPRTFIASASSVVICNGIPVFVDVNEVSQNINPDCLEQTLTERTKAILCIHHAGCPCEMDKILNFAAKHNLFVVEDCAQAHGAKYKGKLVGTFGDIGCFSFCQDKIMTTGGEGGLVVTASEKLWHKIWSFKDHGRNFETLRNLTFKPQFPLVCDTIGSNLRMTEMQAAIGRSFLPKMEEWIKIRRDNARQLDDFFSQYSFIRVPKYGDNIYHSFYEYYVFTIPKMMPEDWNQKRIVSELHKINIPCNCGSCPEVYLEKAFSNIYYPDDSKHNFTQKRLPVAKFLGETSLKLLVHPALAGAGLKQLKAGLGEVLEKVK